MSPETKQNDSSLFHCRKCGIQTRHRWKHWKRPLLIRLFSRTKHIEGWICTECGHRVRVRRVQ